MELNTTTSQATNAAKVTSAYWGYRELTADEICAVAGGDIGDYGDGGDRGYGDGAGYSGDSSNYANVSVDGLNLASGPTTAQATVVCTLIALTMPTPPGFITACVDSMTGRGTSPGGPSDPYRPGGPLWGYVAFEGSN